MPNNIFVRIGNAMRRNDSPAVPDSGRKASPQTPPRPARGPDSPVARRLSFGKASPRQEEGGAKVPRSANRAAQAEWRQRTEDAFAPFAHAIKALDVLRINSDLPGVRPLTYHDVKRFVDMATLFQSYKAARDTPGMPLLQPTHEVTMFNEMLEENLKFMIRAGTLADLEPDELDALAKALDDIEADPRYVQVVETELALPGNERSAKPQVTPESHYRRHVPTDHQGNAAAAHRDEKNFKNTSDQFSRGVLTLELAQKQTNPSGDFTRSDFNHVIALGEHFKSYKQAREALKTRFESYSKERATSEKDAIRAYRDEVAAVAGFRERLLPSLTQAFRNFSGKGLSRKEIQDLSAALLELDPNSTIAIRVREVLSQRPNEDGLPANLPAQSPRKKFIHNDDDPDVIPQAPEQSPKGLQAIKGRSPRKADPHEGSVENLQKEKRARARVSVQMFALAGVDATPKTLSQAARLLPTTTDVPLMDFETLAMSQLREWKLPQLESLAANLERVSGVSTQASLYVGAIRRAIIKVRADKLLDGFGRDVELFTRRQAQAGVFTRQDFNMVVDLANLATNYEATRGNDALIRREKEKLSVGGLPGEVATLDKKLAQDVFVGGNFSDPELEDLKAALIRLGATYSATSVGNVLSIHADAEARIAADYMPPPPDDDENA